MLTHNYYRYITDELQTYYMMVNDNENTRIHKNITGYGKPEM